MQPVLESRLGLHCHGCGHTAVAPDPAETALSNGVAVCPECGEPLSLQSRSAPDLDLFNTPPRSMWHYFDLLPIASRDHVVSLGEGATPLLEAPRLAEVTGRGHVLLKHESVNPTGSFKDRQIAVGISRARELGLDTVAVFSSGNVACSAAAYAARAGMKAVVFMHRHAAPAKVFQAGVYGATVLPVDTASAREVFELCRAACARFGWYHLSTTGSYEPYNVEGAKTIAYELYYQTNGDLPEWIVVPVGGGGLLGGLWRGFLDLKRLGLLEAVPKLCGVQPTGCAPLARAMEDGMTYLESLKHPWPNPQTVAGGLADDILFDGHTALPALRATGGVALAVDDEAILDAEQRLAETEGLLCEPSSAVAIAAIERIPGTGRETRLCCLVTGTGIKDLPALAGRVPDAPIISPSLEALDSILGGTG